MANPLMVVVASIFYVAPLVLAIFIDRQSAAFQRESFGHLKKAARNLRIMAWAIFAYYVAVLTGSAIIGDLQYMYELPLQAEGIQIYVRIGAAIMGYVFALFVARELYNVTIPSKPLRK